MVVNVEECSASEANQNYHQWGNSVHHSRHGNGIIIDDQEIQKSSQQQQQQQLHDLLVNNVDAVMELDDNCNKLINNNPILFVNSVNRGGGFFSWFKIPAGYNPFGFRITEFGELFLSFEGSLDSDLGRFLASLKSDKRKTFSTLKSQWLEIVRVSKTSQSMRVYRQIQEFVDFCIQAGFID